MEASILDLRYKMKDVLRALDRNEAVQILYHGKVKGKIIPCQQNKKVDLKHHPLFNFLSHEKNTVEAEMKRLRGGRYDDL